MIIYSPPEFIKPLNDKYYLYNLNKTIFKCQFCGIPKPKVVWMHNDQLLENNK